MSTFSMLTMDDLMLWNPYGEDIGEVDLISDTTTYIDTLTVKMVAKQYDFYNKHKSTISDEIMLLDKNSRFCEEDDPRDELFRWITALHE